MKHQALRCLVIVVIGAALDVTGCLWLPDTAAQGYTSCTVDAQCAPGRACDEGLCAPPPWNDETFTRRQLVVVTNPSSVNLEAGAAIPITVSADGPVTLSDFGDDGRFTRFDTASQTWSVLPAFRETLDDRLVVWLPLDVDVTPGGTAAVGWLESGSEAPVEPNESATGVFPRFDGFDGEALDETVWRSFGLGDVRVHDGALHVDTNQKVVLRAGLKPPMRVTFEAQLNGRLCGQTFIGLVGHDQAGFDPPSAGFFIGSELLTHGEIAPTADSQPRPLPASKSLTTTKARYTIEVGLSAVRFLVDDVLFDEERSVVPHYAADASLFPVVDVDGNCSVDVAAMFATNQPDPAPVVTTEPVVHRKLL